MALTDITNNWTTSGDTGFFTYDDGSVILYNYKVSGTADGLELSGGGVDQGGRVNLDKPATVEFSEPATGIVVAYIALEQANENGIINVNGDFANLQTMYENGEVTAVDATGTPLSDSAQDAIFQDGTGYVQGGPSTYYVRFNIPVSTLELSSTRSNGAGDAAVDIYVDQAILPCFTAGTLIDTDQGPVPVETLKTGDMVRTKDHGFQPVKWVGESRVYATGFDVPLRIKKGTFGNTRDLVVSKRHKMLMDHTHLSLMFDVEEAFACAMHLRNDDTITREPEGWVTYYHVLLPQHEVIYAEGAATESFYPDEGTLVGMAKGTKEELLENFTLETYGPPARLTFDPMRAMWIGRNLDILQGNDMGQIAAYENAVKAAQ